MKEPLVYLVAGETSGDGLGEGLMRALSALRPGIRFAGIGGDGMKKAGLDSLFPYRDLALMGFVEIVPHIPRLLRRLRQTVLDIMLKQPDIIVTIDSPGFTFRLAKMLKSHAGTCHIKRVHYVAPSVWVYKPQRAAKTALLFDTLLTLLAFEPPYFEKEGLETHCVGHPVLWETLPGDDVAFRRRHGLAANAELLLLLPGSRQGEVKRLLPIFLDAAALCGRYTPVILTAPHLKALATRMAPAHAVIADPGEKRDAFSAAAMALSKSGTITLELAVARVPTVVAHRVSAFSAWLIRRIMTLPPYVSLVNIAANTMILPELIQEACNSAGIALALQTLAHPQTAQRQCDDAAAAIEILRAGRVEHPSMVAAEAVLHCLNKP